ncbi:hypothetical protein D9M71_354790 [compost metagenome]
MLHQRGDLQPMLEQGADDLAQAMVPLMGDSLLQQSVGLDISLAAVPHRWRLALEVRVLDDQFVLIVLVHRQQHRMTFAQEQPSTRLEQGRHGTRPALDARQPDQRADTGVYQVERIGCQHPVSGIHIRLDVINPCPTAFSQSPRLGQRLRREIQPADFGAQAR